jgi:uncharacterized membrane protein YbaN (DUF454 family)
MKIFYGWKMVFAAASLQFLQSMMLHQAFGAYLSVLIQEKGWSKTSVSAASAMIAPSISFCRAMRRPGVPTVTQAGS